MVSRDYRRYRYVRCPKHVTVSCSILPQLPLLWLLNFQYDSGTKQFREAASRFLSCVTVPSHGVSEITVLAYNKYILTSLLCDGKVPDLPSNTSPTVITRYVDRGKYAFTCLPSLSLVCMRFDYCSTHTVYIGYLNSLANILTYPVSYKKI